MPSFFRKIAFIVAVLFIVAACSSEDSGSFDQARGAAAGANWQPPNLRDYGGPVMEDVTIVPYYDANDTGHDDFDTFIRSPEIVDYLISVLKSYRVKRLRVAQREVLPAGMFAPGASFEASMAGFPRGSVR